jgi:proteasome lid subunit RPN8/RPN11
VLRLTSNAYARMIGHAYDGLPEEACGLLGGSMVRGRVDRFAPCANADASTKTYAIGSDDWFRAEREFDEAGLEVVGVMHSHTHTDAYPSPTDIAKADNPLLVGWHYIIVSLRDDAPMLRSWLIDGGNIQEEAVVLLDR